MKILGIFAAVGALVPATAFAVHVSHCCGSVMCCLKHLGCC